MNRDIVIGYIKDEFLSGRLKAGDKLPTERDLAEILNMSRPSIRESLKILQYLGLLTTMQGSGNYISRSFSQSLMEAYELFFTLNNRPIESLIEYRESIELSAVKLIMEKHHKLDFTKFNKAYSELARAGTEYDAALDSLFHQSIVELSSNIFLITSYNSCKYLIESYISSLLAAVKESPTDRHKIARDHENLYLAIKRGDLLEANITLNEHFALIRSVLLDK